MLATSRFPPLREMVNTSSSRIIFSILSCWILMMWKEVLMLSSGLPFFRIETSGT
uniref:Uncharacterized protein n=1 Tax=Xenopus tropicalis TaxID=8364 RepID=A0A1B8XT64_XENTR